jgi:hypothetical protein
VSDRRLALIVSVKAGSERRVAKDLMDALYPYDREVYVKPLGGVLAVYSRLEPNDAERILHHYPIRGILTVRRVVLESEAGDARSSIEFLLKEAVSRGLRFSRLELRSREGGRRELEKYAREMAKQLGLLGKGGVKARIVVFGSTSALCLQRARYTRQKPL